MTYSDIVSILGETGIPFAYDHFAEGESPNPPFICFLFPSSDNFMADGHVYQKIDNLHIELYTDFKQPDIESSLETVLDQHCIAYNKTETWIDTEKLYEVMYTASVLWTD